MVIFKMRIYNNPYFTQLMALVIRPLIAQINAEYSQIPSQMSAYCTLTIHQQRKYTSMYSFNSNQANWEDYVIFDIGDPQSDLWVELWVQQFSTDRKIGEGHIDLKKHYYRSSYRQCEKLELKNMDKPTGVIRLTIEYKSSKQEIEKLKRKIEWEKAAPTIQAVATGTPMNVLNKPAAIQKTPSVLFYNSNSIEESICGSPDTAGFAQMGQSLHGASGIEGESVTSSVTEPIYHPKPQETDLLKNHITNIGEMTPQQYLQYIQQIQQQQTITPSQIEQINYQQNYVAQQNYNGQQNYQTAQNVQQQNQYPNQNQYQQNQYGQNQYTQNQYPQQGNIQKQVKLDMNQQQPNHNGYANEQVYQQYNPQNAQYQQNQQVQGQTTQGGQFQQPQTQHQSQQKQKQQQQQQYPQQYAQHPQVQIPPMIQQQPFNYTQQNYAPQVTARTAANQFTQQQPYYNPNMMRR